MIAVQPDLFVSSPLRNCRRAVEQDYGRVFSLLEKQVIRETDTRREGSRVLVARCYHAEGE